ncbi:hypothetical protein ABT337_31310 [Saccharopolyspora hirsuta]
MTARKMQFARAEPGGEGFDMDAAAESVRKFRAELAAAIGRGHRARAEAHRRAVDFQRGTRELAAQAGTTGEGEQREAALAHRNRMGLEVPEAANPSARDAEEKAQPTGKSQEQTPSDGSDLDFSRAQIMR